MLSDELSNDDELEGEHINVTNQDLHTALAETTTGRPRLGIRNCRQSKILEAWYMVVLLLDPDNTIDKARRRVS